MSNHNLEELEAFARRFDTDKQAGQNGYLPLYIEYFERQCIDRNGKLNILEVGTNKGSSLRMWAEYFPNAKIYGVDITRQYEISHLLDHPRIITTIVDAGNAIALRREFGGLRFDIVIDDGSHEQTDQQVTLGVMFRLIRNGGLFVMEDLITGENWWDANTYNGGRVQPTRAVLQIYQQSGRIHSSVITADELEYIQCNCEYCEYRESSTLIYGNHHPQLAFLGKKA